MTTGDTVSRPMAARSAASGVRQWATAGMAGLVVLLAVLSAMPGLGRAGWVVGVGCGTVLTSWLVRGLGRSGRQVLGPADLVTFGRGLLACGAAALTAESLLGHDVTPALLALAVPALVLDAVDGPVARRTGTVTQFGGRFDGEVDAFLILVLSIAAGSSLGWWVLAAGLARYAFAVAGWVLPWMRRRLEFRYWRKVVTAATGIVLAAAVADVLPRTLTVVAVVVVLGLLAESFGRDVSWLWRRGRELAPPRRGSRALRSGAAAVGGVLAVALGWFALLAPARPDQLTPESFLRLPVEAVAVAAMAAVVSAGPSRSSRAVALVVGALLGTIAVLKLLDLGAFAVLDRPFNVVTDLGQLGSGVAFVRESLGAWAAGGGVLGALLLVGAVVVCLPWAIGRLTGVLAGHRRASTGTVAGLAAAWAVLAVSGLQVAPGAPVAAAEAGPFVVGKVRATTQAYRDRDVFEQAVAADTFRDPASGDLSTLSGKDVLVVFVESYGRVALEEPRFDSVRALLDSGTARLHDAGYRAASAYLTSPTFGGSSWLAHSTLQSGLSVTDQDRYDRLLSSTRTTLTSAFSRAGWRTVAVLPSTLGSWPEGRDFYRFDEVYDGTSLGYSGPRFGFSRVPDQFALAAFGQRELARRDRPRVMAEIVLTSSHGPWAPLPTMVDPAALGDGTVFDDVRAGALTAPELWSDRAAVPTAYGTSITYSLTSLLSFVEQHGDDDLVLIVLGDHQPSTVVSGFGGNRDVPVSIVTRDRDVLAATSGWGWRTGLRPAEDSVVWPMAAFRDRFLTAFGTRGPGASAAGEP
ncbi:hypothetical protein GCM10023168_36090 [Fodinibacter luteus]|uniref:CDP-alcohol phosphatidyltransferase family protein n=1 Tax=Fodinibacter luteus TaxID=552064 RepID=A0ABP8KSA3_9MICO